MQLRLNKINLHDNLSDDVDFCFMGDETQHNKIRISFKHSVSLIRIMPNLLPWQLIRVSRSPIYTKSQTYKKAQTALRSPYHPKA